MRSIRSSHWASLRFCPLIKENILKYTTSFSSQEQKRMWFAARWVIVLLRSDCQNEAWGGKEPMSRCLSFTRNHYYRSELPVVQSKTSWKSLNLPKQKRWYTLFCVLKLRGDVRFIHSKFAKLLVIGSSLFKQPGESHFLQELLFSGLMQPAMRPQCIYLL